MASKKSGATKDSGTALVRGHSGSVKHQPSYAVADG